MNVYTPMVRYRRTGALAAAMAFGLIASEHHGQVKFGGLPVPGATVTASKGDQKLVAVTDLMGAYTFPELADGVWNFRIEMLCFSPIQQEVAVAPNAPSPAWELKLLPFDEIKAAAPPLPAVAPVTTAAAAASPTSAPLGKADAPAAKRKGKQTAQALVPQQGGFQRTQANASGDGAKA